MAGSGVEQLRMAKVPLPPVVDYSRPYEPVDALGQTVHTTAIMAGAGAVLSGVQSTLARQNIGVMGIFTKTGGTIATFAAVGAAYTFVTNASANLRQKKDSYNVALGGFFGGAMVGLRGPSLPAILGYGAALSVAMAAFDYTGGKLNGYTKDATVDEVARKEYLRKNVRRPIEQTIAELGEGRGIYAPGYPERRAARIKEAYGIDVPIGPQAAS